MMPLDPTVGGTTLRRPAIQSPNYDPVAKTGWAIFQDGTAVFHAITVPAGSGGSTTFFQATTPTANNVNDVWVNTANGNSLYSWNGTSWVQYQFGTGSIQAGAITAALIAANTITAAQLAAGIVYAGIINGTTVNAATFTGSVFQGTDFQINTNGAFFYSGTPALGNLIISIANASGTDSFGNSWDAGVIIHGPNGAKIILEDTGTQAAMLLVPASVTHATLNPQLISSAVNAGLVNEVTEMSITSGKESGLDDAAVILVSEAANASAGAQVITEFGGANAVVLTKTLMSVLTGLMSIAGSASPVMEIAPSGTAHSTVVPQLQASVQNAGAVNENYLLLVTSGKSGHDDAAIQLFGETADTTGAAKIVMEFGGVIGAEVTNTGVVNNNTSNQKLYRATCTSSLSVSATLTDIPGATVSVVVGSSNAFILVTASVDSNTAAVASANVITTLSWNGVQQSPQALIVGNGIRATVTQQWVLTGVTAGTYVAKLQATGTSGGTIRATHTTITAVVFEGI